MSGASCGCRAFRSEKIAEIDNTLEYPADGSATGTGRDGDEPVAGRRRPVGRGACLQRVPGAGLAARGGAGLRRHRQSARARDAPRQHWPPAPRAARALHGDVEYRGDIRLPNERGDPRAVQRRRG